MAPHAQHGHSLHEAHVSGPDACTNDRARRAGRHPVGSDGRRRWPQPHRARRQRAQRRCAHWRSYKTPGLSQFFGCRPLGPVGWLTAATASASVTAASIVIPRALTRVGESTTSLLDDIRVRRLPFASAPAPAALAAL